MLDVEKERSAFKRLTSFFLLNLARDEERYVAALDVGVNIYTLIEYPHILWVVADLYHALRARHHGALGCFYADAAARGFGASNNKWSLAGVGKLEEVCYLLAPLFESAEVVAQLLEGNLGSCAPVLPTEDIYQCKDDEGK